MITRYCIELKWRNLWDNISDNLTLNQAREILNELKKKYPSEEYRIERYVI